MTLTATKRLTKSDWLIAGLNAVVDAGPDALKAEPLARRLNPTKGSFYWHFSDVPAFHTAVLSAWEMQASADLLTVVTEDLAPAARLRRLAQAIVERSADQVADPSIRAWARSSKLAEQAVARVDAKRLAFLQELLSELDIDNPEMARIIYAASIGMAGLPVSDARVNSDAVGSLIDLVLALR